LDRQQSVLSSFVEAKGKEGAGLTDSIEKATATLAQIRDAIDSMKQHQEQLRMQLEFDEDQV
jgi:hypothetical protein